MTTILVDDGIAAGSTMRAVVLALRQQGPSKLLVAAPTASASSCDELRKIADDVVAVINPEHFWAVGYWYSALSIRQQQTRWDRCSARRLISLNARLLFLPPELVTYVLVHELCHTKHLNHSPRFWRLVESYLPDYRQLDRQLRNGSRWMPGWLTASCGARAGKLGVGKQANQMRSSAFI